MKTCKDFAGRCCKDCHSKNEVFDATDKEGNVYAQVCCGKIAIATKAALRESSQRALEDDS